MRFAQRLLDPALFKFAAPTKRNSKTTLKEQDISAKILRRWVGLWTDASNMTRDEWVNAVIHKVVQQIDGRVRAEVMVSGTPRKKTRNE